MSIFNKTWKLQEPAPAEFFDSYPEYSSIVKQLLWTRSLKEKKAIEQFLNPDYNKDLQSPFLLKDIKRAVKRISSAIDNNENILIYGDYDVDGVCASTLLRQVFEDLGLSNVSVYIPHRDEEGYGLNKESINSFIKEKISLLITVDCGSTNQKEARYAQSNGIDVIITDHHQVLSGGKFCYAFINPRQKGDNYPFKDLCGTAVVFKLVQALIAYRKNKKCFIPEGAGYEKWFLDLVALATVADVMPLYGENRTFVKYGLLVLAQTRRLGLRFLINGVGIAPVFDKKEQITNLDASTIAFVLAPHLNAAGRMDHANIAMQLLNAQDENSASKLEPPTSAPSICASSINKDIFL